MPIPSTPPRFDALIIGARAAGAATAMLLARAGLKVLVVDREAAGTDTMSTHALMRGGVMQLHRWGLLNALLAKGTPPVRRTTFFYGEMPVEVDIRPSHGVDMLLAPRRYLLDATLVAAARDAGADVRHETALHRLIRNDKGAVTGAVLTGRNGAEYPVHASIVIGADGRRSRVARQVGARTLRRAPRDSACIYAYVEGMQDQGYRWYFDRAATAGAIPTNDGAHCLFATIRTSDLARLRKGRSVDDLWVTSLGAANRALPAEVSTARPVTHPVIFGGAEGHMRECHGDGWALVGDAGYFKDPATAHGLTDALRDAELLARAVIADTPTALATYQRQRDSLSNDLFHLTEQIASFRWDMPRLQMLHTALNRVMKHEQDWMFDAFSAQAAAA